MSEQELTAKMDEALAHVDPDRRKFLGILLAGVAAAPLLTSASLAAQDATGAHFPKNETKVKENTTIKEGKFNTIKLNDQKTQNIKYWDKTGGDSKAQYLKNNESIKLTNANTLKNNSSATPDSLTFGREKMSTSPIKASTGTGQPIKNNSGASPQIKFDGVNSKGVSTGTIKNQAAPIKGETKPAPH